MPDLFIVPLVSPADYPRLRRFLHPAEENAWTYELWLANARGLERSPRLRSAQFVRVNIRPDEMEAWLLAHGKQVDQEGFDAFLNHRGMEAWRAGLSSEEEE